MSFRGAKKALQRLPQRVTGAKSADDEIIKQWHHDFRVSSAGMLFLIEKMNEYGKNWKNLLEHQENLAQLFEEVYHSINEDAVAKFEQKGPKTETFNKIVHKASSPIQHQIEKRRVSSLNSPSSSNSLPSPGAAETDEFGLEDVSVFMETETPQANIAEVTDYEALVKEIKTEILPSIDKFTKHCISRFKEMNEYLNQVSAALDKRDRKKVDYDRYTNALEKLTHKIEEHNKPVDSVGSVKPAGGSPGTSAGMGMQVYEMPEPSESQAVTEKELRNLKDVEMKLEEATQVFMMHDEKIKKYVPLALAFLSEFLARMDTFMLYTQYELYQRVMLKFMDFSRRYGLPVDTSDHLDGIYDVWADRFSAVMPKIEALPDIQAGKTVHEPLKSFDHYAGRDGSPEMVEGSKSLKEKLKPPTGKKIAGGVATGLKNTATSTATVFKKTIRPRKAKVTLKNAKLVLENPVKPFNPEVGVFAQEMDPLTVVSNPSLSAHFEGRSSSNSVAGSPVTKSAQYHVVESHGSGTLTSRFRKLSLTNPLGKTPEYTPADSVLSTMSESSSASYGYVAAGEAVHGVAPVVAEVHSALEMLETETEMASLAEAYTSYTASCMADNAGSFGDLDVLAELEKLQQDEESSVELAEAVKVSGEFTGVLPGDLTVSEGDSVAVVDKVQHETSLFDTEGPPEDAAQPEVYWWKCQAGDGRIGRVPRDVVEASA